MKKKLLILLFLIPLYPVVFSQTIKVSNPIPECDYQIVGTWKNKVVSCKRFYEKEITIVDTLSLSKKVVKVGPKVNKAKKIGSLYYFIHDQFLYEFYFVIDKYTEEGYPIGYNVIVKRNLENMEIVNQKVLDEFLHGQMKFVKTFDEGFFFCLGTSYTPQYNNVNFIYESPKSEIIPKRLFSFNYDLEKFWSTGFYDAPGTVDLYYNDMSFDEDSYLLIPDFHSSFIDGEGRESLPKVIFRVVDLYGEVAKINLNLNDLDGYVVNSVKIKYDPTNKKIHGVLMVSKPIKDNIYFMSEWGYIYADWREDGSLIESNLTIIDKSDILSANIGEYAQRVNLDLNSVSKFNLDSNVGYFDILKDGSALYIANNICLRIEEKLVHSKFIISISKEGKLNWSFSLPYNGNQLYDNVNYMVHDGRLYVYTREFRENFESGTYIFKDTKQGFTGKSLLMSVRVIDLKTGEIISHKPIIEDDAQSKFAPSFRFFSDNPEELMIRYRNTLKNLEKLVRIKFE